MYKAQAVQKESVKIFVEWLRVRVQSLKAMPCNVACSLQFRNGKTNWFVPKPRNLLKCTSHCIYYDWHVHIPHMLVCMHVHAHVCMHVHTHSICMLSHTHTHAHTQTHTHTKKLILQAMNKGPTSPEVHKTDALCIHVFPWLVVRPPRSRGPLPGFKLLFGSVMGTDFPLEVVERKQRWIFIFSYIEWTRINQPATNLKELAPQFHWRNYFFNEFSFQSGFSLRWKSVFYGVFFLLLSG